MGLMRIIILIYCVLLTACASSLSEVGRDKVASYHQGYIPDSALAKYFASLQADDHHDKTGFYALSTGDEALLARIALIESAQHSLDLQYYIFSGDETSQIVLWRLYEAAKRGVKIRLLLDDMQSRDDQILAQLDAHPNIEIRLFNPRLNRASRVFAFLSDFSRLNYRMHNKSLTADGVATIVGGRNIGNEYFSFNNAVEFGDFDLLMVGTAVEQTAQQFDLYWNSEPSIPVTSLVELKADPTPSTLDDYFSAADLKAPFQNGQYDVSRLALFEQLKQGTLVLHWGHARLLYDLPDKVNHHSMVLAQEIGQDFRSAKHSIVVVSPYFVPTEAGTQALIYAAQRGVDIMIVTNSLASNDVFAVHGWYAKYREDLLRHGIKLWEIKASAEIKRQWSLIGSQRASLHAKMLVIDNTELIVGSMNWDPRSTHLNTEMAVSIVQPTYATLLVEKLDEGIKSAAYELRLEDGEIVWFDRESGERFTHEPEASVWRRMGSWLSGVLPIESLL